MRAAAACLALLLAGLAADRAGAVPLRPGWQRIAVPATGTYAMVYLPPDLDLDAAAPAVVFLHGAGSIPSPYTPTVQAAADASGVVAMLPRSLTDQGWGADGDEETVRSVVALVAAELELDGERIAVGGHSSGGAFAYLLAYAVPGPWSAVLSLAAPFRPIDRLADMGYVAPIRMFYGTQDPNYFSALDPLVTQWNRLGVPWELDVEPGYGHNGWPQESLDEGFRFLASHRRPAEDGEDEGGGGGDDPGDGGGDDPGGDGGSDGPCVAEAHRLCLRGGRFVVTVRFSTPDGGAGMGRVASVASADSGLFWFFAPSNWELLVKVLDGCGATGHYWVFAAATTDLAYELRVEDLTGGASQTYVNDAGKPAPALTDTLALASCP
jgi:dienelactone hydrolase